MNLIKTITRIGYLLLGLLIIISASFEASALAAPRQSYVYDKTFRLKGRKFTFKNVADEDRKIHKMIQDASGGVILVGTFTSFSAKTHTRILRLKPNLTLDRSFAPSVNGEILDVALASDGKIFIVGDFTTVDGVSRNGIARLLPTGPLDTSFDPSTGANGFSRNVTHVMPFTDGSVVIYGNFSRVAGILANYGIAKLNSTGAVDTSFITNLLIATLSDGTRTISADLCERLPGDKILVFGFGSDSSTNSADGFQGSTIVNSDGTRTENIKPANGLLTSYHHVRGSFLSGSNAFAYLSHERFDARFTPITETLYRFDSTGLIDPSFKIRKKIYFTAVTLNTDGKFFIAPQTITSLKKNKFVSKPIIERYSNAGKLEVTLVLPKIARTNFEYRNILPLANNQFLVHVRTVKLSSSSATGRTFTHYLIKVKRKR